MYLYKCVYNKADVRNILYVSKDMETPSQELLLNGCLNKTYMFFFFFLVLSTYKLIADNV